MIFFLVIGEPTLGVGSLFYVDSFGQLEEKTTRDLRNGFYYYKSFIYSYILTNKYLYVMIIKI